MRIFVYQPSVIPFIFSECGFLGQPEKSFILNKLQDIPKFGSLLNGRC